MKPKVNENVKHLKWRIDGKEIISDKYPFIVYWELERGKHKIDFSAYTGNNILESNKIEITVVP